VAECVIVAKVIAKVTE